MPVLLKYTSLRVALAALLIASALGVPVSAGGSKEVIPGKVGGLENWQTEFDVTGMKPGVYNLLVEGSDAGGNTATAGPFNVRIDPEMDLPKVSISYPPAGTRIGGRLIMVGTCDDDDGVDRVEWRVDGGEWKTAEGRNFWAITMDAGTLTDGTHRIEVRGVDIHGTPGREYGVPLVFDSSIPYVEIDSRLSGALAAGRVSLAGRAVDANGIASLDVSMDGGQSYTQLRLAGKKGLEPRFSYTIDSRRLADGPFIVWFRVSDKAGSVGYTPFLLLVDNTPPRIEVFSPAADSVVNGNFVAIGAARDDVGLAALEWSLGSASGSIDLEAGNPYWVLPLSVPGGRKPAKERLQLKARDVAGNLTSLNVTLSIDPLADLPLVRIVAPAAGSLVAGEFLLSGTIEDDDGAAALWYRLDDGNPVRVPTTGAFSVLVPATNPGKRSLSVWAEDTSGLQGLPTVLPLIQGGPSVQIRLEQVSLPGPNKTMVDEAFVTGMELPPGSGAVLRGLAEGGSRIIALSYAWEGAPAQALPVPRGPGPVAFSLPLPKDGPWGTVTLEILGRDEHGRETIFRSLVYLTNYTRTRGDPLVRFDNPQLGPAGLLLISPDRPLVGSFSGAILAGVELDPPSEYLRVASSQDRIEVSAVREGPPGKHRVLVTTDKGHVFASEELFLGTDLTSPVLELQPLPAFAGQSLDLAGTVKDASGLASLRARIRGQPDWMELALPGEENQDKFSAELSLDGQAEGPLFVEVEAVDTAGQSRLAWLATVKDTLPPVFRPITPEPKEAGAYRVAGFVRDTGGLASVEGPSGPLQAAADGFISFMVAVTQEVKPVLRVVDRAGNSAEIDLPWPSSVLGRLEPPTQESGLEKSSPTGLAGEAGSEKGAEIPGGDISVGAPAGDGSAEGGVGDGIGLAGGTPGTTGGAPSPSGEALGQPGGTAAPASSARSKAPPKPELVALWPPAGEVLDGDFTAVVQIHSIDPLVALTWSGGGNAGALDPGEGPIQVIRVPAAAPGARRLNLSIQARTSAGGAASLSIPLATDSAKAVPQLKVEAPPRASLVPMVFLSAVAGSGLSGFSYVLDGAAPVSIQSSGAAVLELAGLAVGSRVLNVVSQGLAGVASPGTKISVPVMGPGPRIKVDALVGKDGRRDFAGAGALILPGDAKLSGTVDSPNDLASLTISVNRGNPITLNARKAPGGGFTFEAPLPPSLPPDLLEFVLLAVDKVGNEDRYAGSFYRILPAPPSGLRDEEGIFFNDVRLSGASGDLPRIPLFDARPLLGRFIGRPLESIQTDIPSSVVSVVFSGSQIRLEPGEEGISEPLTLIARTVDGDEYTWGPFVVFRDLGNPDLQVQAPVQDAWVRDTVRVEVRASDPNGIDRVEVTTDGSTWVPLIPETRAAVSGVDTAVRPGPAAALEETPVYQAELDLSSLPEGGIFLTVRATDAAGRVAERVVAVSKDVTPPVIQLVAPASGDSPNGRTTVAALVSDTGALAMLEMALGGEDYQPVPLTSFVSAKAELTGRLEGPAPVAFRATDRAGNVAELIPAFEVDPQADLPRVVIQAPREGELVRGDFVVSGVVFDDDGAAAAYYRLDESEWTRVELEGSSFSIPFELAKVGDNEHVIEVYGEDLYGVTGEPVSVSFKVSTAEPVAYLETPSLEDTVRGVVMLNGVATDENGIAEVHLSFDNAVSFQRVEGTEAWTYPLDTRILSDGTRSIIIRTRDAYGVEGISAGIMTADNIPPTVTLDLPGDGDEVFKTLSISGRVGDTTAIAEVYAELSGKGGGEILQRLELDTSAVVQARMDVSELPAGNYVLRLGVRDRAANETFVTRELVLHETRPGLSLDIRLPVSGEKVTGKLVVAGRFSGARYPATVTLLADGIEIGSAEADETGFYSGRIADDRLPADGPLVLSARAFDPEGNPVLSRAIPLEWSRTGPWATVEGFDFGQYIPYRPLLSGRAGWIGEVPSDPKEARELLKARTPTRVEVSLDEGRSFAPAKGGQDWRFRLETQDYPEGGLYPLVRVRYGDGSTAVLRTVLGLDKTAPRLEVLDPMEGARFDNRIPINGTAWDDRGLESLSVYLRSGDKAGYELPSFIQGLYLDTHFLGASYWDIGLGLTFFDEAVKLQIQLGDAPPVTEAPDSVRFGGRVYGVKLLASLARLPFGFLFGPDWDFLAAEAMVGANFSFFSESVSGDGLVIAAVVAQLEFPKITIKEWSFLRTYSFYTEAQFWSVSSDVQSGVVPRLSLGLRFGLF